PITTPDLHSCPTRRSSDLPYPPAAPGDPRDERAARRRGDYGEDPGAGRPDQQLYRETRPGLDRVAAGQGVPPEARTGVNGFRRLDRKSTRLNSSHVKISYA